MNITLKSILLLWWAVRMVYGPWSVVITSLSWIRLSHSWQRRVLNVQQKTALNRDQEWCDVQNHLIPSYIRVLV